MLILRHCSVPEKYALSLRISRGLHLNVFNQPEKNHFCNNLLFFFVDSQIGKPVSLTVFAPLNVYYIIADEVC